MGLIIKDYIVTGDKGSDTVTALLDTGAAASFIRKDIAERIVTPGYNNPAAKVSLWPTARER